MIQGDENNTNIEIKKNISFSKIAYFGSPFLGHILPYLNLFEILKENYGIDMYNSKNFTKEFNCYFDNVHYLESTIDINPDDIFLTFFKICIPTYEEITNLWDKYSYIPSIIISDQAATYAPFISKRYNIPCFSIEVSFPLDEKGLDKFSEIFLNDFGKDKINKLNQFNMIIKQIEEKFETKVKKTLSNYPNHLLLSLNKISVCLAPPDYKFKYPINKLCFGPIFRNEGSLDFNLEKYKNSKIVFVSLGTLYGSKNIFYKNIILCCLKLFKSDIVFLISICDDKIRNEIFKEFDNKYLERKGIIIRSYWNQIKILKYCDLFISHCGYGSFQEAIYFKVPILAYPLKSDQFFIADEVKKLVIGEILPDLFDENILYCNIYQLLKDKKYKKNIEFYSSLIKPEKTIPKYLKLIESLIHK